MKLKERFWLWGQDAGSHHASAVWKLPGVNRMGPAEGARYFGLKKMCRVVMKGKPEPPFDKESEELSFLKEVVWSAMGDSGSVRNDKESDLEEILRQAEKYPNITGAILDDFFKKGDLPKQKIGRYSLETIAEMRNRLHSFPLRSLDLWVVWYKHQLHFPIEEYLAIFDVIAYWNWTITPKELDTLEEDLAFVVEKSPGKRRFAGCYMWNYGEGRPVTIHEIRTQCETFQKWIHQGDIEGIIFLSNNLADLDLEAVEWAKKWIQEVGDEEIGTHSG